MNARIGIFSWISGLLTMVFVGRVYAAVSVNPRASGTEVMARQGTNLAQSRVATNRSRSVVPVRGAVIDSAATRVRVASAARTGTVRKARTTANVPAAVSRAARSLKPNTAAARNVSRADNLARSGVARATAIFGDLGKIGSGYAACRESYATCMDQICATANDDYRRCFCSSRYDEFRATEDALSQAVLMLQQFQDNNLDAVDKTAAEVAAMYSATEGEQAIKRDTSAAAKMLDNINNLLSGKSSTTGGYSNSLGVLDLDFTSDLGDIWSGDATSLFSSGTDLSTLTGSALFSAAQKQCARLSQNNCENDAAASMSKSSYNILITQDCNIYEKTLNTKRESVYKAVRAAEKALREARLDEYRSHNSADVNECIAKVRTAILADTACGENYKRCLDPTGAYINGATGEAIYTPRLFELEDTISLGGWSETNKDVLTPNQRYSMFLDTYRKYVVRELDTCRDIADFVWTEFKRNALIEIAQAQSAKIEEVKSSCVDTISKCYDSTTQSLVNMDKKTATAAGVLGRYASADMCREDVATCAMVWAPKTGNFEKCTFDGRGHITNDAQCGLRSLWNYVVAVDDLNRVSKCADAIEEYVTDLCTPDNGNYGYPYNCRNMRNTDDDQWDDNMNIGTAIKKYAIANCMDPTKKADKEENWDKKYELLESQIRTKVESMISEVKESVRDSLGDICEDLGGLWYSAGATQPTGDDAKDLTVFYATVSGRGAQDSTIGTWGYCYQNSEKLMCEAYNDDAPDDEVFTSWNSATETCEFSSGWYEYMCETALGGYYDTDMCYIPNE